MADKNPKHMLKKKQVKAKDKKKHIYVNVVHFHKIFTKN